MMTVSFYAFLAAQAHCIASQHAGPYGCLENAYAYASDRTSNDFESEGAARDTQLLSSTCFRLMAGQGEEDM